eukprot:253728_1
MAGGCASIITLVLLGLVIVVCVGLPIMICIGLIALCFYGLNRCCISEEQQKEDKRLGKELQDEKRKDQSVKKLLFLGSGDSGKSTLFKQLRTLHGTGYADKDRLQFKDHIFAQIVEQMRLC